MIVPVSSFNTLYDQIKLTQINELNYDCLSLLLLNSVSYQCLSSIFTFMRAVSYDVLPDFLLFLEQKMLYNFNAEDNIRPFQRL